MRRRDRTIALVGALALLALGASGAGAEEAKSAAESTRRLEDVHIEGEIPVPQVLFVTGRDQRRFLDFQHRRYLRSSLVLAQEGILPTRVLLIGPVWEETRKETTP